jgi:microcin C transport system permease protein
MTPLNRRRLANFRANRRGYWSFWIFLVLFVLSLGAEVVANDRPLFVSYKGQWMFPAFVDYPEEVFGGFEATTDYRDPTIAGEIDAHGYMIWPPIKFANDTTELAPLTALPSPPTWVASSAQCAKWAKEHPQASGGDGKGCAELDTMLLGADAGGHDVLARLIYGFRMSVIFGLTLAIFSSVVGIAAGAVQGYFGGWTDLIFQRFIEIWSSLPSLYILIILSSFLAPGFMVLLTIQLLFSWVSLVHVVRAEFLRARNFEYVNAARALGLTDFRIIVKHVLPNAMVATITFLPFIVSSSIGALTALDYLGLGMPPGSPSLGELLFEGKSNLHAPWLALSGFVVVAGMLTLLVFIGEAVRDAFDPRKGFT